MLINNDTFQRETVSEQPIRQPLKSTLVAFTSRGVELVTKKKKKKKKKGERTSGLIFVMLR